MNPKVSIIVPVYKVEPYLAECLDSVVNQTLRDVEILCAFDESSDRSGEILNTYVQRDSRMRVVRQPNPKGGLSGARNAGVEIASGEYILYADSDDFLDLRLAEKAYGLACRWDADMVMFFPQSFGATERLAPSVLRAFPDVLDSALEKVKAEFSNWQTAWGNLYRREFLEKNGLRFHDGLLSEDVPYVTRASLLANRIAILSEPMYHYRQREDSLMADPTRKNYLTRTTCYHTMFNDILPLNPPEDCLRFLTTMKYHTLYDAYQTKILRSDRTFFRDEIRRTMLPQELGWLREDLLDIAPDTRQFFLSVYGTFGERVRAQMKLWKYRFADTIAKRLFPHSCWMQRLTEELDSTQKTLAENQKVWRERLEKVEKGERP